MRGRGRGRGATNVLYVLLWIMVAVILLFSFFGPFNLRSKVSDFFDYLFGGAVPESVPVSQQEAVVPFRLERVVLPSDPIMARERLVQLALDCYRVGGLRRRYSARVIEPCAVVSFNGSVLARSDVVGRLSQRNPDVQLPERYPASGWCLPSHISELSGEFLIFYGAGGGLGTNLYFYYNASSPGRSILLDSSPYVAVDQLAASLARCWFLAKAANGDYVCDTINPSALRGVVTKLDVLGRLPFYFEGDELEKAYGSLDDWWESDGDAYMEDPISSRSSVFYSCSSDFGSLFNPDDLCLTHDRENDCCT